jgi:hypothetical protein
MRSGRSRTPAALLRLREELSMSRPVCDEVSNNGRDSEAEEIITIIYAERDCGKGLDGLK